MQNLPLKLLFTSVVWLQINKKEMLEQTHTLINAEQFKIKKLTQIVSVLTQCLLRAAECSAECDYTTAQCSCLRDTHRCGLQWERKNTVHRRKTGQGSYVIKI